jgi:hypothetical protein
VPPLLISGIPIPEPFLRLHPISSVPAGGARFSSLSGDQEGAAGCHSRQRQARMAFLFNKFQEVSVPVRAPKHLATVGGISICLIPPGRGRRNPSRISLTRGKFQTMLRALTWEMLGTQLCIFCSQLRSLLLLPRFALSFKAPAYSFV